MPKMMRRAIVVLSWVVGILVAWLIALVVTVLVIDPDSYRPSLERELTRLLGREVSADHLSVGFSLVPSISVQGLRIANPSWASRSQMLVAKDVNFSLDLIGLIHGSIEIDGATVSGLDLFLEQGDGGIGNWAFPALSPKAEKADRTAPMQLPNFDAISLRDANIVWRSATGDPMDIRIEAADAVLRSDSPIELEANIIYRQVPINAELRATVSLQDVFNRQPLSASVGLRSGQTRADLEIYTPVFLDPSAWSVNFAGKGDRLDALSLLAGQSLPAWGPYRVSGTMTFAGNQFQLANLRIFAEGLGAPPSLPISRLQIDAGELFVGPGVSTSLQLAGKLDDTNFRLDATTADVARLTEGVDSIPVLAKVALDDFEMGVEGTVSLPATSGSFELATYFKGDVAVPARLIGAASFAKALRVDLSGRIEGGATQITATGLRGTVGQCAVGGDLALRLAPPLQVSGALNLGHLDLAAFEVAVASKQSDVGQKPDFGPPPWLDAVGVDLRLQAASIAGLPVAAADLSAHAVLKESRLEIRKFRGAVANTLLIADAGLQWKGKRPYLEAKISLPVLDLSGSDTGRKAARNSVKDGFFDKKFQLAPLRELDADLAFAIGRIDGLSVSVNSVRGSAKLSRGRLFVPSLHVALADISSLSTATLDARRDDALLRATVSAGNVNIANLLKKLEIDAPFSGTVGQPAATMETHGRSPRAWIENAKIALRTGASMVRYRDGEEALTVREASAIASPGTGSRAELHGRLGEYPVDLVVTGGRLADLLDEKPLWPKITAELHATFRETPIRLSAQSALHALASGRNVPVRIQMRVPGGTAIAAGTIADMREPKRTPVNFNVSLKSLATLPFFLDESPLPDIPVAASARLIFDEKAVALSGIDLRAGKSDLSGSVRLIYGDRMRLSADLSGELLDFREWIPEEPNARLNEGSVPSSEQPFDLEPIRQMDADLSLHAKRAISNRLDLDDLRFRLSLDGGLLNFAMSMAEGDSKFALMFDARPDIPVASITARTKELDRETLKPESVKATGPGKPRISARGQFAGVGATPREMFASARGELLVSAGPGRARRGPSPFLLDALSADLLNTLTPGKKTDDYNDLECGAVHFTVADGVASSPDGIALRFKPMDILGSGAINLQTREILFGFKAVRRKWWSIGALDLAGDLAAIRGTLDQPKVVLDTEGALIKGGAAWATMGVSLLATNFFRKLSASEDPCAAIIEKGRTAANPIDTLINSLQLPGPMKLP